MNLTQSVSEQTEIHEWFDNLVDSFVALLRSDQLQLETGLANKEKKDFYKPFLENNTLEIGALNRKSGSKLIIPELIKDYFEGFILRSIKVYSLSLQLSDSNILVWAVVNDDDEAAMDQLFLLEAQINAKYGDYGLHISSTVMEKSDNCPVPPQFQSVM